MGDRSPGDVRWPVDLAVAGIFAVVLVGGSLGAAVLQGDRARPLDVAAFVLVIAASLATLGLRRRAPVWALVGAMTAVSTYLLSGYPYGPIQLCMVIAIFEVGRQSALRTSLGACAVAAIVASTAVMPRLMLEVDAPLLVALGWASWIVLPWSLGALVHVTAAAREQARRDLMARVAGEERLRLADELHDVAGHGFALVAMHAGVAMLLFDEQPDQARVSLEAIKATSDRSLVALRGMLDTFHPRGGGLGLAGIGALVDEVRAAGLTVDLQMGEVAVTEEVDPVAYRVVQESLTNVLRHAGPTAAKVRIERIDTDVLVLVCDRGRGARGVTEGRGLAGMRQRVEAVGGRFEAGPRDGGGFTVSARMPLPGGYQ